jgi:hypothetical protein
MPDAPDNQEQKPSAEELKRAFEAFKKRHSPEW